MKKLYLIGSLRNPEVPKIAEALRAAGYEVFDSWFAAGEIADDSWRDYCKHRGLTLKQGLKEYAAQHILDFDRTHLLRCDGAVLVMPAGKSGHLELGFVAGQGKPVFVLFDEEPVRWDVMLGFAEIATSVPELLEEMGRAFGE